MASSSIVIKVRYGETLRRLNAVINDKKLVFDMVMLKEKIRKLFSFGSDVEFIMTYADEDGDEVTLADDDDLRDIARQSLNPLRITVNLSSKFNGTSGNSTPLKSPQNQLSVQTLNSGDLEALAKLSLDMASKASSVPAVAEQVQKVTEGVKFKDNVPYKGTTDGLEKKKDSSSDKKDDNSGGFLNEPLKHDSFVEHVNQGKQIHASKWKHLRDYMMAQTARSAQTAAHLQKITNDYGSSSGWAQGMLNASNQCPFSGVPLTGSGLQGPHYGSYSPQWKRDNSDNDMSSLYHWGIICDGCEANPIAGPRFKSKVKIDYDLCNVCFAKMGNATDYIRIDQPTNSFRHPLSPFKSLRLPRTMWAPGLKQSRLKLDSQFILDVNVVDGTILAPCTAFTKIWRMRNSGSDPWPYGSQLQWIWGDRLSKSLSVDVKIPMHGLPVDKELDIAVEFTAPELPGRYESSWRMSSPSGEKFGQRVWVLIKVEASMKNLGETSINLNLPPVPRDPEAVNQDHLVDNIFPGNIVTDYENPHLDQPPKDHAMNFPINDSLIINNDGVSSTMGMLSAPPETASVSVFNPTEVGAALGSLKAGSMGTSGLGGEPIRYPTVDFSVMPPIMSSGAASLPRVVVQPPSGSGSQVASDDEEQALVKELEAMGFKNMDLNKEILRMNNYDLDKSIDDLCGVLEWDPMLDELREMGFADDEVNRRLLKKNNGSIKGVVMDLINEERA